MALTLNDAEAFAYAGRKAAIGRNRGDESFAASWSDWARRAWNLEKPADRVTARQAFDAAYTATRRIGRMA